MATKSLKQNYRLQSPGSNKRINALYQRVASYLHSARRNVLRAVDTEMVQAYWLIGRDIVQEEQQGALRAEYGKELIKQLSDRLMAEFGRGYGTSTLADMRKFYLCYPQDGESKIFHTLRGKFSIPEFNSNLGWSHYRLLMRIERQEAKAFYEIEASNNHWSSRELDRQIGSLLFDRLAKSKDKKGLVKLARKGQELINPIDAIKEPVILEFLNIPETHRLVESKLEQAFIFTY